MITLLLNSYLDVKFETPAIDYHTILADSRDSLRGEMVLSNTDKEAFMEHIDEFSSILTHEIEADEQNIHSHVEVIDVRQLSDGTLAVDYECKDVFNQEAAKKRLEKAVRQDYMKKIIIDSAKGHTLTHTRRRKATKRPSKSD